MLSHWCPALMEIHWPERLELVAVFPVTLTGKIRKVELKKRYAGG